MIIIKNGPYCWEEMTREGTAVLSLFLLCRTSPRRITVDWAPGTCCRSSTHWVASLNGSKRLQRGSICTNWAGLKLSPSNVCICTTKTSLPASAFQRLNRNEKCCRNQVESPSDTTKDYIAHNPHFKPILAESSNTWRKNLRGGSQGHAAVDLALDVDVLGRQILHLDHHKESDSLPSMTYVRLEFDERKHRHFPLSYINSLASMGHPSGART